MRDLPHKPKVLIVGYLISHVPGRRSSSEDLADYLSRVGWQVSEASPLKNRLLRTVHMVIAACLLRGRAVAQLSVYSGRPFVWAYLVSIGLRLTKRPYVVSLHGGNLPAFARRFPALMKGFLYSANLVTAPSDYLRTTLAFCRDDIIVIPNPIYVRRYASRVVTNPRPRLIWVRSFHSIYNPKMALKVVHALRRQYPDVRLIMIGAEREKGLIENLRAYSEELGIDDCTRIVPGVRSDQLPDWLENSDIFLNTTNVDNTPVSVVEAMASGLCIVSTNVGGVPYLLHSEVDCLLTEPEDVQQMVAAVQRILREPGLAGRLSANAIRNASKCDWSNCGPAWESLLTQLAEAVEP